jgi:oligogalacturonide transport system substrate-binding protein
MTMGERICVLKEGVIQQVDTPTALYDRPANAFVAGFIGSPEMNLAARAVRPRACVWGWASSCCRCRPRAPTPALATARLQLGLRPEHIGVLPSGRSGELAVPALLRFTGAHGQRDLRARRGRRTADDRARAGRVRLGAAPTLARGSAITLQFRWRTRTCSHATRRARACGDEAACSCRAALGLLLAPLAPAVHAQVPACCASPGGAAARHAATLKALRLFEQRHPGLRVKAEYMGFNGYLERLTTQIAGGSEPDLMQINWAWLAMFSKRGTGFADLRHTNAAGAGPVQRPSDLAMGAWRASSTRCRCRTPRACCCGTPASFGAPGWRCPTTWDELFAAGPPSASRLGDRAYPLDGELYDMLLLAQAYVQQRHGTPYVDPFPSGQPARGHERGRGAGLGARSTSAWWTSTPATPLPLRASLGGAEKPTEQQPDWVTGRWAGNYTWDSLIGLRSSARCRPASAGAGRFPTLPGARDSGMFGRPTLMFAVGRNSRQRRDWPRADELPAHRPRGRAAAGPHARPALGTQQRWRRCCGRRRQPAAAGARRRTSRSGPARGRPHRRCPAPLFEHARLQKFMREVFETVAYGKADATRSRAPPRRRGQCAAATHPLKEP